MNAKEARRALRKFADPDKAIFLQRFFKSGPGEYAEGDILLGVTVPNTRAVANAFKDLSLQEIQVLLTSKIHEERLLALLIIGGQMGRSKDPAAREKIFQFYLKNRKYVNNWDLVDTSAENIIGAHLFREEKPHVSVDGKRLLRKLALSKSIWDRRIAVLATFHFIRRGHFAETISLARILLNDEHDLIRKAVGWMLREIGKRELKIEEAFLNRYAHQMPRTMLRYAIERFSAQKRAKYLLQTSKNS